MSDEKFLTINDEKVVANEGETTYQLVKRYAREKGIANFYVFSADTDEEVQPTDDIDWGTKLTITARPTPKLQKS